MNDLEVKSIADIADTLDSLGLKLEDEVVGGWLQGEESPDPGDIRAVIKTLASRRKVIRAVERQLGSLTLLSGLKPDDENGD
jgi:hypothetical protein